MKKYILSSAIIAGLVLGLPVSAHVVVTPNQAGIGAYTRFSMGVPSEKPMATIAVKLLVPQGIKNITPNVKPGWTVTIKKDTHGNPTEVDWTGGIIPAGERDEFVFQVQVPASPTTLQWKAYQTYADGSIVSWDQDPASEKGDNDFESTGPYSQTQVINDLASQQSQVSTSSSSAAKSQVATALTVSFVALAFSIIAMASARRNKK